MVFPAGCPIPSVVVGAEVPWMSLLPQRLRAAWRRVSANGRQTSHPSSESPPSEVGSEVLWDAVSSGEHVILVTFGPAESEQLVRAFAARLNASAGADCAIVVRMDAPPSSMIPRIVRVFGMPFVMADTASILGVALRARIFPVFADTTNSSRQRIHVCDAFFSRGRSEVALQRTGQRMAWALERFARQIPGYASIVESACCQNDSCLHPACACEQTRECAQLLPLRPSASVAVEQAIGR